MKKVIDEYNREVCVDENRKKLYSYSNKDEKIIWSAPIVDDSEKDVEFWTNYIERGTVDDISLKLETVNNKIKLMYAIYVNFNANENDSDGKIWNKFTKIVEEHQKVFFDEYGDFRKNMLISEDDVRKMVSE